MSCYYFGRWDGPGHFLFGPGKTHVPRETEQRIVYFACRVLPPRIHLDGALAPRLIRHTRQLTCDWLMPVRDAQGLRNHSSECSQGKYLRHYLPNNFTALQWWDRCQGDTRPGCNSTILLEGERLRTDLLAVLALVFPHVLQNMINAGIEPTEVQLGS